jgi:hypothetical protein
MTVARLRRWTTSGLLLLAGACAASDTSPTKRVRAAAVTVRADDSVHLALSLSLSLSLERGDRPAAPLEMLRSIRA